jgi:hypothetical protein
MKPPARVGPGDGQASDTGKAPIRNGEIMKRKLDATEACQGETRHQVRYVLAISLAAAVVAMAIVAAVVLY